jgi:hypothetical protein
MTTPDVELLAWGSAQGGAVIEVRVSGGPPRLLGDGCGCSRTRDRSRDDVPGGLWTFRPCEAHGRELWERGSWTTL